MRRAGSRPSTRCSTSRSTSSATTSCHVDGKPRHDGVRDLLRSRGIDPAPETVRDIGDRKQALVEQALAAGGVEAFPGSVEWVEQLRDAGLHTAVVSSSANAGAVLEAAGISGLFDVTIDGRDVTRLGLRGKPAPDGFLLAAMHLGVEPRHSIVVEDAVAGVAAGRCGGFGLVIGVARGATRGACGRPAPTSSSAISRSWRHDPAPLADRGIALLPRADGRARVGVRGRQRLPRRARHARGGRPGARRRRDPQRLPRDVADRLSRGRLRPRPHGPDGRERDRRLDRPPVRRRRAVRRRRPRGRSASSACSTCSTGVLCREVEWETARGRRMLVRSRRLASLADRHLVAIDYEVTALDGDVSIALSSELVTHAPQRDRRRSAPRQGVRREGARPARGARARRARRAPSRDPQQRARDGVRDRAPDRRRRRCDRRVERATATARRSSCSPTCEPANRCGCPSTSPTTGRRRRRPASSCTACTARWTARRAPATTRSSAPTPGTWRSSGAAATSRSRARPSSSRRRASTCSS